MFNTYVFKKLLNFQPDFNKLLVCPTEVSEKPRTFCNKYF